MSVKTIVVSEACDGFSISLLYENGNNETYTFDQEDTKEELVSVFKALGFNSNYEEVY
jgi:hypothetical protein